MSFDLRITIPDQPGAPGAVAIALSRGRANIVTLDVVEHTATGSRSRIQAPSTNR